MAKPSTKIPQRREDIEGWAAALQAGCLNEDARRLVAAAAAEYLACFDAIERHYAAQRALDEALEQLAAEPQEQAAQLRVKVAAMRVKASPGEVTVRAKLVPLVVQMLGKAQAANRAEADAAIVQLRQYAAAREKFAAEFGPSHKARARAPRTTRPPARPRRARGDA